MTEEKPLVNIELIKQTGDWVDAFYALRSTQNPTLEYDEKEPSTLMKKKMFVSMHSPIRMVRYLFRATIPNKTQNHAVRHNLGIHWFVATLRSDLTDADDLKVHRMTERTVVFEMNLEAIVNFTRKRICRKSEAETTRMAYGIIKAIIDKEPDVFVGTGFFMPRCYYCQEVFLDCNNGKHSEEQIDEIIAHGHLGGWHK